MIRLVRPTAIPGSLFLPVVQTYLTAYAAHVANPTTVAKPKKPSNYRSWDVLQIFETDFFAKCYLTEESFYSAGVMDVDHFIPAGQNPNLTFDWNNLFPASHQANMMRPRTLPVGGLLNPCVDNVEVEITYFLDPFGEDPGFLARDSTNVKAANTVALLNRLHNGDGTIKSIQGTKHLRVAIQRKFIQVIQAHNEYMIAQSTGTPQEQAQTEHNLRMLLSRRKAFTMLMRSIPAINKNLSHLFD
jgi:hypothetical protein